MYNVECSWQPAVDVFSVAQTTIKGCLLAERTKMNTTKTRNRDDARMCTTGEGHDDTTQNKNREKKIWL